MAVVIVVQIHVPDETGGELIKADQDPVALGEEGVESQRQVRVVLEQGLGGGRHLGDADPVVLEVVHDADEEVVLVRVLLLERLLHHLHEAHRVLHRRRPRSGGGAGGRHVLRPTCCTSDRPKTDHRRLIVSTHHRSDGNNDIYIADLTSRSTQSRGWGGIRFN